MSDQIHCDICKDFYDESEIESIVNNKNYGGTLDDICEYCINDFELSECKLCPFMMIHEGLDIPGFGMICVQCMSSRYTDFIEFKFESEPCFPWKYFEYKDPDQLCNQCGRVHPGEDDEFAFHFSFKEGERRFILLDGEQDMCKAFSRMMKEDPASPLIKLLIEEFVPFVKAEQAKEDEAEELKLNTRRTEAKRIIRQYCPSVGEEEIEKFVAKKIDLNDRILSEAEKSFLGFVNLLNES
jgi:hypothetical protein